MNVRRIIIFIWILGLAIIRFGWAAEKKEPKAKEEETFKLEKITVMEPQPGVEITADKTIIRMDKFKKVGAVRTVTDVLREIGGIDVQRLNPLMASPGDEVSIRGLNEGRMVIEIDGRRINHTGHYGRYIVDWSTLNIDDIDRIEIIRGGHSVLHPFAIGGVINLITKKGKKTDKLKPDINISSGISSFSTYYAKGAIDGGLANFVGYHFSLSRQQTDGYLRNNYQRNNTFNGGLRFFLPWEATVYLGAKLSKVAYGFPVINDPRRPDFDPDYPPFVNPDWLRHIPAAIQLPGPPYPHWDKRTYYLDAILKVPIGPGTAKLHFFETNGKRSLDFYRPMRGKIVFVPTDDVRDVSRGVIAEYRDIQLLGWNSVTLGLEYQLLGWPPQNPMIYIVRSAYAQDVISIGDKLTFTPGARYYYVDMDTYFSWFEKGKPKPGFPTAGKSQRDDGWYPSFRLDFHATPDTALYAAISRCYRLPCP